MEEERIAALRGLALRWAWGVGIFLLLFGVWRLFLLVLPSRDWPVLRWSLEPATAATWNEPWIPALVAENALENGGVVGEAVGRRLYARALAPASAVTMSGAPQPYGAVHLGLAWLGTEEVDWSTEPFRGGAVLVHVGVQAKVAAPVQVGSCTETQEATGLVARDYVVVQTAAGWRVEYIYIRDDGAPVGPAAGIGSGTAAAALAGCG